MPDGSEVAVGDEVMGVGFDPGVADPGLVFALPAGWGDDLAAGDLVALVAERDRVRRVRADDPRVVRPPLAPATRDPTSGLSSPTWPRSTPCPW